MIAKGGHKLKASADDPAGMPPGPPKMDENSALAGPGLVVRIMPGPNGPSARAVARAQPLSKLTAMLGAQLKRPVLDKTGLSGIYDFNIEFAIDLSGVPLPPGFEPTGAAPGDGASPPLPDLAAAVQQQLGLRLTPGRARIDVLVIDKAEKVPTEN